MLEISGYKNDKKKVVYCRDVLDQSESQYKIVTKVITVKIIRSLPA